MGRDTIFDLLDKIFQRAAASYLVAGGFAVNAHGYSRTTRDIDLVIDEERYPALRQEFEKESFKESYRGKVHARFSGHPEMIMDIDLLFVDPKTFQGLLEAAEERKVGSCSLKVISLNHLIAMKLHAIKQNPGSREGRDLVDVTHLIRINRLNVFSEEFKNLCLRFGTEEAYQKILSYEERKK